METIKVNMSPNPLDVQTIHASQNDNEAREWGFELHNNGDAIDSSSISDQLVFKAYKGGTEQILPENTSTPTTSPFKGDIKYPQGELTNQEFLYRESPTEEDGLAWITDIKGNTLVWNQVAPATSSSVWVANRCTKTVSGNTFSLVGTNNASYSFGVYIALANLKLTVNHDYLFMCVVNTSRGTQIRFTFDSDGRYTSITPNKDNVYSRVVSAATEGPIVCYINHPSSITTSDTATIKNLMIVDLTMLNDSRITDLDSFKTYYPLDYYDYNQGTLLSFNGNGIKTVGKNLLPKMTSSVANGITWTVNEDGTVVANGTASADSQLAIPIKLPEGNYYFNGCPDGGNDSSTWNCYMWDLTTGTRAKQWDRTSNVLNNTNSTQSRQFYSNGTNRYFYACRVMAGQTVSNLVFKPMVRLSSADDVYEPYTSSTTDLPTLTYFPTGMKSARNVYDELLPTKAITRIGMVNLGDLNWSYASSNPGHERFNVAFPDAKLPLTANDKANLICAIYENATNNETFSHAKDKLIAIGNTGYLFVYDSAYTTVSAFKTAMSGVYLYYELATPTETSFTTASLVTENAEIPLSNNDGTLIGKCTEQLSENPGFIDAKIKLSDADGECYSNKIQLHVERSPQ